MAKKTQPSVEDAIKSFKEVMQRASLSDYYYVGNILLSKNTSNSKILVVPDQDLWVKLIDDEEFKPFLKEPDLTNPEESNIPAWMEYGKEIDTDWIPIDISADLYTGKVFRITLNKYEYKIPINRDLMPMKLKKSEYEGVAYRVFYKPLQILAIKKRFENVLDGYGFTIIRLFQII
jgi:hypothetical protein